MFESSRSLFRRFKKRKEWACGEGAKWKSRETPGALWCYKQEETLRGKIGDWGKCGRRVAHIPSHGKTAGRKINEVRKPTNRAGNVRPTFSRACFGAVKDRKTVLKRGSKNNTEDGIVRKGVEFSGFWSRKRRRPTGKNGSS